MPAYQTLNHHDEISIEVVEDDLEPRRSVYFTDQSPTFQIKVENTGEKPIQGRTNLRLSFERSPEDYESGTHTPVVVDLEPGETQTIDHELDMLSYQGGAAVVVDKFRIRDRDDHLEINKKSGNRLFRLYTFMVYDREYYRLNYLRPRRAQYLSAILAVLIIAVGVLQIIGV
ncbi:hypothetical protein ACOZ32_14075 (plasmid) [Halobacterium sp. MBLA0001]|uniref:hypothetical protein n=1 Tax=Halobacterium sp. MBLA0001 TaxID=3413511 RepID=UPI003C789812